MKVFRFRGRLMNATIENFIDRLTRLSVAITNSESELARVTAERDAREVVLERVMGLLAAEVGK